MKEEEAARCPELGAEVPNANSTEGGRGAMCVPFARKEAQWYGALADGCALLNSEWPGKVGGDEGERLKVEGAVQEAAWEARAPKVNSTCEVGGSVCAPFT